MLIDSNILIYALNTSSPKFTTAQNFLQQHSHELVFAQQNIFETLRILTHPKFPHPFSTSQAIEAVEAITDQATILSPTYETPTIAKTLIKKYKITGTEIFDAYLVATALSNDEKEICSDNTKHLQKYREITLIYPYA